MPLIADLSGAVILFHFALFAFVGLLSAGVLIWNEARFRLGYPFPYVEGEF